MTATPNQNAADEYNRAEFEAGRLTWRHITRAIAQSQAVFELNVDGKAGPATREKLVPPPAPPAPPVDRRIAAGQRALARALAEWKLGVRDPKRSDKSAEADRARSAIERYMHDGAGWPGSYAGDGAVEWCGIFAAYCWAEDLDAELRRDFLPSTYRLENWRNGRPPLGDGKGARKTLPVSLELGPDSTAADVAVFAPRAGDILVVGDGRPEYGEHITIVREFIASSGWFRTVEGNGGGEFPDGTRGQGVVTAMRPLGRRPGVSYIARRLYRPGADDLT